MRISEPETLGGDDGGGFGLRDIHGALRLRWRLIAGLAVLGGFIGWIISLGMPVRYEGVATVQIDPRKKTIVSVDAVLPDIAGDTPTIESQVEILRSKAIALKVIEALDLRNDPEFTPQPLWFRMWSGIPFVRSRPAWRQALGRPGSSARSAEEARGVGGPPAGSASVIPSYDDVAAEFADRLRTWRVRNSLVVEIRFLARDPVKAARIANTIADVYIRDQIELKVKATAYASGLLENRLDGLRKKVSEAELKVAKFKSENNIFDAGTELLSEKQLARLMEQTVIARNATANAKARYDQLQTQLRSGDGSDIAEVLQSHTIQLMKDQMAKASRTEAELMTRYGPKHPELIKARAELAEARARLRAEVGKILVNVKNEYEVAANRERTLEQSLTQLKVQQTVAKGVSVKLHDLQREAESTRQVLDAFLGRYKQTTEVQDLHLPDARIVELADVPRVPIGPKRKQISLVGLFAGLGLGLGLALLLELLTPGLVRPEDTVTALGVPHLASVPMLKRSSDGMGDPMAAAKVVLARPDGAFARAMWKLISSVDKARRDPSPRVIMVASGLPSEGKTVLASNLALLMARRNGRTLIIDADMRRSALSHQLGVGQAPGLMDAVYHGQDLESVLLRDSGTGLVVLPAGGARGIDLAPLDVLEAPGFGQRLARLKAHFDTIIIDTPPLLPVVDARAVAEYADQIIFVAAWQKTTKELVRKAVSLLGGNGVKIIGAVINQVDPVERPTNATAQARVARSGERRRLRAA